MSISVTDQTSLPQSDRPFCHEDWIQTPPLLYPTKNAPPAMRQERARQSRSKSCQCQDFRSHISVVNRCRTSRRTLPSNFILISSKPRRSRRRAHAEVNLAGRSVSVREHPIGLSECSVAKRSLKKKLMHKTERSSNALCCHARLDLYTVRSLFMLQFHRKRYAVMMSDGPVGSMAALMALSGT